MDEIDEPMEGDPEEGPTIPPSPMDSVMARLTAEQREKALRIAHQYSIPEGDVSWTFVLLVLDAKEAQFWAGQAAQAAGEAADRIRDEIRGLPDGIKVSIAKGLEEAAGNFAKVSTATVAAASAEIHKASAMEKAAMAQALKIAMGEAIQQAVGEIVHNTNVLSLKTQSRKWLTIGAASVTICISLLAGVGGWWVFEKGEGAGEGIGLTVGAGFSHLMLCDRPGWKVVVKNDGTRVCTPYPSPEGQYGWIINK